MSNAIGCLNFRLLSYFSVRLGLDRAFKISGLLELLGSLLGLGRLVGLGGLGIYLLLFLSIVMYEYMGENGALALAPP